MNVSNTTASLTLTSAPGVDLQSPGITLRRPRQLAGLRLIKNRAQHVDRAVRPRLRRNQAFAYIKINSATPGYVATDLNNHSGPRTVEQGARIIVKLATLPTDGPSGGFFNEHGAVAW